MKINLQHTYANGGDAAMGDVTAANQVWHNSIQLAQLGVLVFDGRPWTLVQCHQHEELRHVQSQQLQLLKNTFHCCELTASEKCILLLKAYSFWKTRSVVENLRLLKNAFHCWKLTESTKCVLLLKAYSFWKTCSAVENLQLLKNTFCCWKLTAAEKHILPLKTSCFWKTH